MSRRTIPALAIIGLFACTLVAEGARANAPAADSLARRLLACTACHAAEGRPGRDAYYPRIAGKPEGYLYNQLVNFRDGRRFYGLMTPLVEHLPDAYLREIAAYFAGLELPHPAPQPPNVAPAALERGRQLVTVGDAERRLPACSDCHGSALTGVAPAIPGVVGLPRDYLVAQLGAWASGLRRAQPPDCMAEIARRMSPDDIAAVAAWLAVQPVPIGATYASSASRPPPLECGSARGTPAAGRR